jgi:hypothetical protein
MAIRAYYTERISDFLEDDPERVLGILAAHHHHNLEEQQTSAWRREIAILKTALCGSLDGRIFLELYIPRMGKRADVVLILGNIVFVIEFKVGASQYDGGAFLQVEDYALDLKNFHEGSHGVPIVPVLVATNAESKPQRLPSFADDLVATPVAASANDFGEIIHRICIATKFPPLDVDDWMAKGYRPTPTIIQAAEVLYRTHSVADIRRNDAGAKNLDATSASVGAVIDHARDTNTKTICFVTGVPGSGKTLAGLNIATQRFETHREEHAVFLSGNGPLVAVLREALARDKAQREGVTKRQAEREVHSFIQNVHHFRDEYLKNHSAPLEKVVIFDEAQRAWTREQASSFMIRKRGWVDFDMSEPEFLISVMDRNSDWCTIVCLVGGGQEINTGEAGISEWIRALESRFPNWEVYVSPRIVLPEYGSEAEMREFLKSERVTPDEHLHLAVSMRSFRAEALSDFVGHVVNNEPETASAIYGTIAEDYPIYVTRDLNEARSWLRNQARGSERYGLVASSGALRLKPVGIHIRAQIDPTDWFLNPEVDVRSSYYLEDVASEFEVQGLELDWVGVCWDADFRYEKGRWTYHSFKGTKWLRVKDESRRLYLKNAYRVLLTRARQGMVIFVPNGDQSDHTRPPDFYEETYQYLRRCAIPDLKR